ncbi:TPA: hypothetical protein ACH3X1_010813 [Trebouxia sp. C0004]
MAPAPGLDCDWSLPRKVTFAALQTEVVKLARPAYCVCALAGDPQRPPTKAEQPSFNRSHVNEDDLGAAELGAVCAAARKHVSCGGDNCGDSEELAGLNGDIDMEGEAVDTTPEEA